MTTSLPQISPAKKRVWTVLLLFHLLAVIAPPLAFQARGTLGLSPSVATAIWPVEGYSQFLYLDRGYAFFAPDPGPSQLLEARITSAGGTVREQMYPDRSLQWPRLLYHRHFMLTEFLGANYQAPGLPPELAEADPEQQKQFLLGRKRYETLRQSMLDHLQSIHPDSKVEIRRLRHLLPDWAQYQAEPIELTDRRLYEVLLDQPVDLPPDASPGMMPVPAGSSAEVER